MKKGEACYLALVLPKKAVVAAQQGSPDLEHQGMTQKVKRALMKERGAIRKPPPVKETRRKIYMEVPREVRDGLDKIYPTLRICSLSSYQRAGLQNGRWNLPSKPSQVLLRPTDHHIG